MFAIMMLVVIGLVDCLWMRCAISSREENPSNEVEGTNIEKLLVSSPRRKMGYEKAVLSHHCCFSFYGWYAVA
jgi:hypothetical protein